MATPLVLHLLPADIARGAQMFAGELRRALDTNAVHHRTATLFSSLPSSPGAGALRPDVALAVPSGIPRRCGFDPRAVVRLRKLLRELGPAVVVAHGGEPLKYAVLAGVSRSRLAYYKIGAGNERLTGLRRVMHRRLVRRTNVIAAVSEAAACEVFALGIPRERVVVIANGRDPDVFRPGPRREDACPVRLAFVGHLDPPKRPSRFVELVGALRNEGLAVAGVVAGEGPLLESLRALAQAAGVELLGLVDDVPALLANSDVFVLTSLPMEGMPGVLIEAGLTGLPAITTDVPGAADVVLDGETGFVVPADDFDALVAAARALVTDGEMRGRMGDAARTRCERDFSFEASAHKWQELLARVIVEQSGSAHAEQSPPDSVES